MKNGCHYRQALALDQGQLRLVLEYQLQGRDALIGGEGSQCPSLFLQRKENLDG